MISWFSPPIRIAARLWATRHERGGKNRRRAEVHAREIVWVTRAAENCPHFYFRFTIWPIYASRKYMSAYPISWGRYGDAVSRAEADALLDILAVASDRQDSSSTICSQRRSCTTLCRPEGRTQMPMSDQTADDFELPSVEAYEALVGAETAPSVRTAAIRGKPLPGH